MVDSNNKQEKKKYKSKNIFIDQIKINIWREILIRKHLTINDEANKINLIKSQQTAINTDVDIIS